MRQYDCSSFKAFISQPTASQAIRELEEHYGVLLFERLSKRLYITEAGKKLLFYAKEVVKEFDSLESKMNNLNKKDKIRVVLQYLSEIVF